MAYAFKFSVLLYLFLICETRLDQGNKLPLVINTWAFTNATERAWEAFKSGNPVDAVEAGCAMCEYMQCDGTVGYGGSPDENGETTLDAMVMDGENLNVGAVAGLRRIKHAISVARRVLENTKHSFLVGDQATQFAVGLGFTEETLQTAKSQKIHKDWIENNCQPNFWTNVVPDPNEVCGPYQPAPRLFLEDFHENDINFGFNNHDTIGIIAIDTENRIAAGTSTNGAKHKIPGRVGDSPIPGAGAYADNDVGAATATGDGDVMMRLLPSFLAVEEMRRGSNPKQAADVAVKRIIEKYPNFFGGVIAVNKFGDYGASCHGMERFPFSVRNDLFGKVVVETVPCAFPPNKKTVLMV